ncbi:MAG: AAA family ATPase [Bacteroidaceae bacterium]|nr:AAA family ATPase [Bacteroidaceae bacterium]
MINSFLSTKIRENFASPPTGEQSEAINLMGEFLMSRRGMELFLLRGYAGTGKTTLVGALVRTLAQLRQPVVLMAPTGRAAKVFSSYSGFPAYTIHKRIYRQKSITDDSSFSLNVNLSKHTLFIVDEASMISNEGLSSVFGTGRLLDDLVQYVYSGEGCRLMLMGDTAQLPPVGEEESPALSPSLLSAYGLEIFETTLTQVMRQLSQSGILYNATMVRCRLLELQNEFSPSLSQSSVFSFRFPDVVRIAGSELVDSLSTSYSRWGTDECMVICRSNKRANIYNLGIRNMILDREDELNTGDRLMIVKNNYYWIEKELREAKREEGTGKSEELGVGRPDGNASLAPLPSSPPLSFIANGDIAVVRRVRRTRELYGFRFADVLLTFPDYDDYELEATILLDTLHSESPALTREESDRLFEGVMEDYAHVAQKKERYKLLREDPHFNALQVKYAYAVTCHKAQGGQWSCVYLDQGYLPPDASTIDYYRWLYTAFTRATEQIYLVNWPEG